MRPILRSQFFGLRPWRRHSLVLLVAGLVYMLIGASYVYTDPLPSREAALQLALKWFPIEVWGGVFMVCGALALISSRWPPISKTWGYMVLTGLSSGWAAFYLMGVLIFHTSRQNLSAVLSWGLIAFLWWAISGLRNPGEPDVLCDAHFMAEHHNEQVHIELSELGETKEG